MLTLQDRPKVLNEEDDKPERSLLEKMLEKAERAVVRREPLPRRAEPAAQRETPLPYALD